MKTSFKSKEYMNMKKQQEGCYDSSVLFSSTAPLGILIGFLLEIRQTFPFRVTFPLNRTSPSNLRESNSEMSGGTGNLR